MKRFTVAVAALFFVFIAVVCKAADKKYAVIEKKVISANNVTHEKWIENKDGKTIAKLKNFEVYSDGKRLRLYSELGYYLDNIPMNEEIYFNECMEVFIEGEKELPRTYWCLRNNSYKYRSLRGLKFSFPNNPERYVSKGKKEYTRFRSGKKWVVGLTPSLGGNRAYVTNGPSLYSNHSIIAHEYVHMCGYSNNDHDKKVFDCALKK